jgi:SAM-dependent methyltransferase
MTDPEYLRSSAPAALRNREPILDVLRKVLPASGRVLEVASGTGEHIIHFARHLPDLEWQPSDPSPEARQSIVAWTQAERLNNIREPLDCDAAQSPWPVDQAAAIICINMLHISPWEATVGLMRGAASVLPGGGLLYLYGPYRRADRPLAPGNEAFDRDLRARNARWGLRELDTVIACGAEHGLVFEQSIDMPANNLSVIFRKA